MTAKEPGSRPKIVLVEDEAMMRSLVKLHLTNAGYEVLEAADAVEGGHLVVDSSPDLIICDVKMPYMSGYDFVAALKSDPDTSHIPVVFLTMDEEVASRSKKLGAEAYLRKPVTADRLLEVVGLFTSRPAQG